MAKCLPANAVGAEVVEHLRRQDPVSGQRLLDDSSQFFTFNACGWGRGSPSRHGDRALGNRLQRLGGSEVEVVAGNLHTVIDDHAARGHHHGDAAGRRFVEALVCGEEVELGICLPDVLQADTALGLLLTLGPDRQPRRRSHPGRVGTTLVGGLERPGA